MNVLFLDDDSNRTKRFKRTYPYASTTTTAEGMIHLLRKGDEVDILFLDHDLGGLTFVDSGDKNTGAEVVRWIVEHKPKIQLIVVHSLNYPAAIRMEADLIDAGYHAQRCPFTALNLE